MRSEQTQLRSLAASRTLPQLSRVGCQVSGYSSREYVLASTARLSNERAFVAWNPLTTLQNHAQECGSSSGKLVFTAV
jgi:hypothetical protein